MRVSVLPATGIDQTYTYEADDAGIRPGSYVMVTLGRKLVPGVVWDDAPDESLDAKKLKPVTPVAVEGLPPMAEAMRRFIDRVADYNVAPRGLVLKMAVPLPAALQPKRAIKPAVFKKPDPGHAGMTLNESQNAAAAVLLEAMATREFSTTLLDGVTGSGKTEVYFEAVAQALREGRQVLVLLPEIALSNSFLARFEKRFGADPVVWHSGISMAAKKRAYMGIAKGEAKVVIGARSALFLPFADLGLIVVDEEHDTSYKQDEGVHYHARDMAVLRGSVENIPVVLSSATPSLETVHNAHTGRYGAAHLPDRFGGAHLPEVQLVDMRVSPPERGAFLSPALNAAIADTLARGEQALLFLNRRGYAPLTLCRSCGHRLECPQCTSWLVEHRQAGRVACHHCGFGGRMPDKCPKCSATDSLVPCGPGVERIAEEVAQTFPAARPIILASDMAGEKGEHLGDALAQIQSGAADIIIGTQIIAKGHHFPRLTFVGVVDADIGLKGGDLRASEQTWQLLHQVAGRAGRVAGRQGHVMVQTYMPEARVMQALADHDRNAFLDVELYERSAAHMPPFARMAAVIVSGLHEKDVVENARALARAAPQAEGLELMGPAPAPLYRLRGRFRMRFLLLADKRFPMQAYMRDWLNSVKLPSSIRVSPDIDPYSFV